MDRRDFFKVGGAIIATAPFIPTESTETVRVPFLLVDTPNKNGNIYPKNSVKAALENLEDSLMGHLGMEDQRVNFSQVSHMIDKMSFEKIEGKEWLCGKLTVLNTPQGKVLKTLLEDKVALAFRTAGTATCTEVDGGVRVIGRDFKIHSVNVLPEEDAA
jgi:hypothetical protein